jgi:hypothetical protein
MKGPGWAASGQFDPIAGREPILKPLQRLLPTNLISKYKPQPPRQLQCPPEMGRTTHAPPAGRALYRISNQCSGIRGLGVFTQAASITGNQFSAISKARA